jgi:sugar/nucleoside kinase (ribokinase family)
MLNVAHGSAARNSYPVDSIWYVHAYALGPASAQRAADVSGPRGRSAGRPHFDYTAVGHVTVDVGADGSRRPGGGAFYSGLQAARLGQRTLIITRGVPEEIEAMLGPFSEELSLRVIPSQRTTTLETIAESPARAQRLLSWAGPLAAPHDLDTAVLHLAPVARETSPRWLGRADFVGLTAQGLVRSWAHDGAQLEQRALEPREVPAHCDAIVVSEEEHASAQALEHGDETVVAITRAAGATLVHAQGEQPFEVQVAPIEVVHDDVGAGDVFAAALFTALARGEPPRRAVAFGHAAAAVRIAGDGATAIGDAGAIEQRLSALT